MCKRTRLEASPPPTDGSILERKLHLPTKNQRDLRVKGVPHYTPRLLYFSSIRSNTRAAEQIHLLVSIHIQSLCAAFHLNFFSSSYSYIILLIEARDKSGAIYTRVKLLHDTIEFLNKRIIWIGWMNKPSLESINKVEVQMHFFLNLSCGVWTYMILNEQQRKLDQPYKGSKLRRGLPLPFFILNISFDDVPV